MPVPKVSRRDSSLVFSDGLSMQGDTAEKLTERLARFAGGAAYVSAVAEAKA